jgi:hypothetical protein
LLGSSVQPVTFLSKLRASADRAAVFMLLLLLVPAARVLGQGLSVMQHHAALLQRILLATTAAATVRRHQQQLAQVPGLQEQ